MREHGKSREWLLARIHVEESGCWLWLGDKGAGSLVKYGRIRDRVNGRVFMATHAVYEELVGPIPDGLMLLHSCDNGFCVNPEHLRPGTHDDNMRDMVERDRQRSGEKHGRAKLSQEQIDAIRSDERTQRAIAADYGISQGQVSRIKRRQRWR